MKKKLIALCVVMLMACCLFSVTAFAGNIVFDGEAGDFVDAGGNENLFEEFQNMEPGSSASETLKLQNKSKDTLRYYMRAEILKSFGEGGAFELTIVSGDNTVYDGVMGGVDAFGQSQDANSDYLAGDFLLTTLEPDETEDLALTIAIDGDGFNNELQGSEALFRFVFSVENEETPATTVSQVNSKENIVVDRVVQKTVVSGTAASGTRTGDNNALLLFAVIGGVCLIAIVVLLVWKKKKDASEE